MKLQGFIIYYREEKRKKEEERIHKEQEKKKEEEFKTKREEKQRAVLLGFLVKSEIKKVCLNFAHTDWNMSPYLGFPFI